jgi:hypothetical protein
MAFDLETYHVRIGNLGGPTGALLWTSSVVVLPSTISHVIQDMLSFCVFFIQFMD